MWGPQDSLKSIVYSLQSPHFRGMLGTSFALALMGRFIAPRVMWMPRWLRKGRLGSVVSFWFVVLWMLYYYFYVVERPALRFRRTSWNAMIMERFELPFFRPVFWAFHTHAQSVLCNSLNKLDEVLKPFASFRREQLPAFDGNKVVLDWAQDSTINALPPDAPIVMILHGIYGSATDNYCRNIVSLFASRGWRSVVHDRWRIDFAETRDVEVALTAIQARYPTAPIFAVGFSAGGHVLLSALQKMKERIPLVGAVVVSPALDLVRMIHHMRRQWNSSYRVAMDGCIRACVRRHLAGDKNIDKESVRPLLKQMSKMGSHQIYDTFLCCLSTYSNNPEDPYEANNWRRTHPVMSRTHNHGHDSHSGGVHLPSSPPPPLHSMQEVQHAQASRITSAMNAIAPSPSITSSSGSGSALADNAAPAAAQPSSASARSAASEHQQEWGVEGTARLDSADLDGSSGVEVGVFGTRMERIASKDTLRPLPTETYSPFGNATAPHYSRTAAQNLHQVAVPTLILMAADDPMMSPTFMHTLDRGARENPNVIFARTERGGHTGFHQGIYPAGPSYAEKLVVDFCAAVASAHSHTAFIVDVVTRSMQDDAGGQASPRSPCGDSDGGCSPEPMSMRVSAAKAAWLRENGHRRGGGVNGGGSAAADSFKSYEPGDSRAGSPQDAAADVRAATGLPSEWSPRAKGLWQQLQAELAEGGQGGVVLDPQPSRPHTHRRRGGSFGVPPTHLARICSSCQLAAADGGPAHGGGSSAGDLPSLEGF